MSPHPVQLRVEASRIARLQVVVRLAILAALATLGCSSLYGALYFALPAIVALLVSGDGGKHYLEADAPAALRVLRWLAGAYGYLWMLTDALPAAKRPPTRPSGGPTELTVEVGGSPSVSSSLARLVTSLPALLALVILSMAGAVLWVVAAVCILVTGDMPAPIREFFLVMLRFQFRCVAYHLSLVEVYPTLTDAPLPHASHTV
jgi:hypothetical protein